MHVRDHIQYQCTAVCACMSDHIVCNGNGVTHLPLAFEDPLLPSSLLITFLISVLSLVSMLIELSSFSLTSVQSSKCGTYKSNQVT
jgi:hypothetical protein